MPVFLQGIPCYAESKDGISWIKPDLGQVEIQGNKKNNALLLTDESIYGVAVIKDNDFVLKSVSKPLNMSDFIAVLNNIRY